MRFGSLSIMLTWTSMQYNLFQSISLIRWISKGAYNWGQSRSAQVTCDAVPRLVSLPFIIALRGWVYSTALVMGTPIALRTTHLEYQEMKATTCLCSSPTQVAALRY